MQLSVVMPVFNEEGTIDEIVARVQAAPFEKEIIIVDDCSTDGTRDQIEALREQCENIRVCLHERNQGKGAALRTGFEAVSGDYVIVQDADLEYDPADYPLLMGPLLDGRADVIYGSRFLGGPHRVLFFWHSVGNRFLTLLSNMLTNLNLTDMETCYKAFRRSVLDDLRIRSNRFGVEPEMTAKFARKGWRIYEVPISYAGRKYEEGKKITWRDGFKALFAIFYFRFFD